MQPQQVASQEFTAAKLFKFNEEIASGTGVNGVLGWAVARGLSADGVRSAFRGNENETLVALSVEMSFLGVKALPLRCDAVGGRLSRKWSPGPLSI